MYVGYVGRYEVFTNIDGLFLLLLHMAIIFIIIAIWVFPFSPPFSLFYALVLRTKLRATHTSGKHSATGLPLYLYIYLWFCFKFETVS